MRHLVRERSMPGSTVVYHSPIHAGIVALMACLCVFAQPAAAGCDVQYVIDSQWNSGFVARVTIRNDSGQRVDGWQLDWTMPDGQGVGNLWNGVHSQRGDDVSVVNASYNAAIQPGGEVRFGFVGRHAGSNRAPGRFVLNGTMCGEPTEDEPTVRFVTPQDGERVVAPVGVVMEATGLVVEPAGEVHDGAGHLHVLVDTDFVPPGQTIPADARHIHLGQGQLEASLELEPGVHTLRLQFADGHHTALDGDQYRDEIVITVEPPGECEVDYHVRNQWNSGFVADVTITNHGTRPIDGWTADWTMPDGQRVLHAWNGGAQQTGDRVTVDNMSYNARISAGGTVSFGFSASHDGTNGAPAAVLVNGVACAMGPPDNVSVRFVTPTDGATLSETFDVRMAVEGLVVEPAGEVRDGAGHLHILVDTEFIAPGEQIPSTAAHVHYGQGQLEATLTLAPGPHTLRLQFADGLHTALAGDQYRDAIAITVEDDDPGDDPEVPPETGEALYISKTCNTCHGDDGKGVGNFPALGGPFDSRDALIEKIATSMPFGDAASCDENCATLIADYILVAFAGTDPEPPVLACQGEVPGPRVLRLLTRREYDATTETLLGVTTPLAEKLPIEARVLGYDNNLGLNVVTAAHVDAYLAAAEDLAARALSSNRAGLLGCDETDPGCARQFVTDLGLRAYRRPLTSDEVTRLTGLFITSTSFDEGMELAITAMLVSPHFLYRSEVGEPGGGGYYDLTPYEVATSLSYLFWGTMPDQTLFDAAAAGALSTPDQRRAQAARMLGDPRARAQIGVFMAQWLGADPVRAGEKDPVAYPAYTEAVRAASDAELVEFVNHVIFDGTGEFKELFDADYVFANDALAAYYGFAGATGSQLQRIPVNDATRGGVLSLASVLAAHAHSDDSSPVKRGVFVRERLLCHDLPPPPPTVDNTPPALDPSLTTRERFAVHSSAEFCQVCHQYIDGVGFGFEAYDGAGEHRLLENGEPVDDSGNILGLEEYDPTDLQAPLPDVEFQGVRELSTLIAGSDAGPYCMTLQYFRHASGREDTVSDGCTVDAMFDRFSASGYDIYELLLSIVTSPSFVLRQDAEGGQ